MKKDRDAEMLGATISGCGAYRYHLWRDGLLDGVDRTTLTMRHGPRALWIMLNPSTADANEDDATIRKCRGFSQRMDCERLDVVNLYALRSRHPAELWKVADPVGPENDDHIRRAAHEASIIILAWGANAGKDRALEVCALLYLNGCGAKMHALSVTGGGMPGHPLMLPYALQPFAWRL